MIELNTIPLKKSINTAYFKIKPVRNDFENFKDQLFKLLSLINNKESEDHNKNFVRDFLINTFYSDKYVNTSGKTDLAIHLGKSSKSFIGVIIETKRPSEKYEMLSEDNLNCKAMHEVILYYLRERIDKRNDEIKNIIITNAYKWFIFKADQFEKHFYKSKLKNEYVKWRDDKKVSKLNDHFYNEIVKKYIDESDTEIEVVTFDLRDFEKYLNKKDEKQLIPLFKNYSPPELLKEPFANDSNTLNKQFYTELLHIIGLEEYKEGSKKKIGRKDENRRNNGSLLENTIRMLKAKDVIKNFDDISVYGSIEQEQLYNIALELNIVWINRIMFLKLLEAQLVNYHTGDKNYKFLEPKVISQYDDLFELFHEVLAVKNNERNPDLISKFNKIPYLNSSLFELSELEKKTINISELKDRFNLPFYKKTVFGKDIRSRGELPALEYLLLFLDKHDFASESGEEILEEHKTIMNASVLGLIFEKINGYKEGSFYTPGFITMYMARETLRRAVVQKFNEIRGTKYKDYEELRKNIDTSFSGREEANKIINELKICDPAVGSGHFLVSCLNEIIAIKADLKVLNYRDGRQVQNYCFEIENDELVITNEETDELFDYHLNPSDKPITALHELQEALFHEKETVIENCLFGVDINPNSVNICRLRLWIEILKNSYFTSESNYSELETLPNIDINIKQGNSLISRFDVKQDIFTHADKQTLDVYKLNVALYKNEQDKNKRRELKDSIENTKERFRGIAVDPLKKEREQIDKLAEKLHKLNTHSLFDGNISIEEQEKIEKKRNKLVEKINKLTELKSKKAEEYLKLYANAFEWRFEFPEVLDDKGDFAGFDMVIGNPPYYSLTKVKELSNYFESAGYKTYTKGTDIYCLFYEKGNQILREKGLLTYITSNSWLRSIYGEPLKNYFIENMQPINLLNIEDIQIFEEATVESNIITLQKSNDGNAFFVSNLNDNYIFGTSLSEYFNENSFEFLIPNTPEWIIASEGTVKLKLKIEKGSKLLKQFDVKINFGIKTGFNAAFIIDEGTMNRLIEEDPKCAEIIKPILRGRDLKKYSYEYADYYLINSHNGVKSKNIVRINVKEDCTVIYKYLESFKPHLEKRQDQGDHWSNLRNCTYLEEFEKSKIIWGEISDDPKFAFDNENYYAEATTFLMTGEKLKYFLAILNSKLSEWYFKLIGTTTGMGTNRWKKYKIECLPIKVPTKEIVNKIEKIVDQIIVAKKQNPQADTNNLESEIDKMVYKLYGLTKEEIKIVEGK